MGGGHEGGGQCAWEGGVHGRRAVHMGGGQHAWEEGSTHGRRVACMGGQCAWEEGSTCQWGPAGEEGRDAWWGPKPCRRRARSRKWGPWSMGGATGGSGHVGQGRDACKGIGTWVDGQVGSVVIGSMVVGQHGCGATWLWGSMAMVVGKGGTHHQCDACDMSLLVPLAAAVRGTPSIHPVYLVSP